MRTSDNIDVGKARYAELLRLRNPKRRQAPSMTHVTPAGGNIFADLGFPDAEAESLKPRLVLMAEIYRIIDERGLKQADAAKLLGVSQPRVSDLMRRKIDAFSTDSLIRMLRHAGCSVEITVNRAA